MDTLHVLTSRRGIFRFKPDPVEPEKIEQVLQAAANAPSPANLQPWAFVVTTEASLRRQVANYLIRTQADCVFGALLGMSDEIKVQQTEAYADLTDVPCFITLCLEPKVEFALPEHRDALYAWYLVSLGGALANLMAAATALNLGTRLIGGYGLDYRGQGLRELLEVPSHVNTVVTTPLGYVEAGEPSPPPQDPGEMAGFRRGDPSTLPNLFRGRLPLGRLVHQDRW